jgi:dTDP-4-dehydrorhamnose reductase
LQGELGVLSVAKESIVSRVNFFGWSPDGKRSILEFFLRELQLGKKINGYTDFIVTSMYVRQLCSDLNDLVQVGFRGIIHLSSLDSVSKYDFGVLAANAFDLDPSLINPVTAKTLYSEGTISRARNLALDSDLASKILGRQRPSQESGITEARVNAKRVTRKFRIQENDWRRKI